jgi:hypothetical protein
LNPTGTTLTCKVTDRASTFSDTSAVLRPAKAGIQTLVRARALAAKADAAIDPIRFQEVIAKRSSEGYDSYKYFDKRLSLALSRLTAKAGSLVAAARDIFGVAAAIDVNTLGRQLEHAVGQRRQEMPVVRNEQHGALILR